MNAIFATRAECPSCASTNFTKIFSKRLLDPTIRPYVDRKIGDPGVLESFGDMNYSLLKCGNCGLIFQENILTDHFLAKLYDEWLVHREEIPQSIRFFPYYANELLTIASLFDKPVHEIRVLDYGLGAAKWARVAMAIGFDVYGTDLSTQLMEDAKAYGIKTIPISEVPGHSFDFINTEQVFEHLARPRETFSQLSASVRHGGIFKVSVPDGRGIEGRLGNMDWSAPRGSKNYLIPVTPLVHINTFTNEAIQHLGRQFGFEPIQPKLKNEMMMIDATSPKNLFKSIARPMYRRLWPSAYVFLQRTASSEH